MSHAAVVIMKGLPFLLFHEKQGTTTANVFSTTFPTSVDALFEESERYNTCMITGKVLQDRNLPEPLRDISAEGSVSSSFTRQQWAKTERGPSNPYLRYMSV